MCVPLEGVAILFPAFVHIRLAWHDLDCCGASACADHRLEIWAAMVLRPVRVVDEIVNRPVDRLEGDFLGYVSSSNPPCFLAHCGLVPTGLLPVVRAHVELVTDNDGPNPRWRPVGHTVLTERRYVHVIGLGN